MAERDRAGYPRVRFEWVRGHSDEKISAQDRSVHHERNIMADKATKTVKWDHPILTLRGHPRYRLTYTTHAYENTEAEAELTIGVRAHIAATAALAESYKHEGQRAKRRYGRQCRAGEFVDTTDRNTKYVGNQLIVRLLQEGLPDEATKAMYRGADREATCICGCRYSRPQHIFFACKHGTIRDMRKHWIMDIIDAFREQGVKGADELVQEFWKLNEEGDIELAAEAEESDFKAPWTSEDKPVPSETESNSSEEVGDKDETKQDWVLAPDGHTKEKYDLDWNGIYAGADPQGRARALLRDEVTKNLTVTDFWLNRTTRDAPALMATACSLTQGRMLKLQIKLNDIRNRWSSAIWAEHQGAARKVGSPVRERRRQELLDEWEVLERRIRGVPNNHGRCMISREEAEAKGWQDVALGHLLREWRRVETQWERNGGAGQSSLLRYNFTIKRTLTRRRDRPAPPPRQQPATRGTIGAGGMGAADTDDDGALPQAAQEEDPAPHPKRTRSSRQQPAQKSQRRRPRKRTLTHAASAATRSSRQPNKRRPEGREGTDSESDESRERGRRLLGRERRKLLQVSMHLGGGNTGTQPD